MPLKLHVQFRVLTPLYLGGAQPEPKAELRAPSIKGALRFWLRAIAPWVTTLKSKPLDWESYFMGGAGGQAGQAPFLLRVEQSAPETPAWPVIEQEKRRFNQSGLTSFLQNGLGYLAYPFGMKAKELDNKNRTFIQPGTDLRLQFVFPRGMTDSQARALLASIWCLGHCGGLGSRARRGFGAVALINWRLEGDGHFRGAKLTRDAWQGLLDSLPLASEAKDVTRWQATLAEVLQRFQQSWLPTPATGSAARTWAFPWFGPECRYGLEARSMPQDDWGLALDSLGRPMQEFRQKREPDCSGVLDWIKEPSKMKTPERASFGLPLNFQFKGVKPSAEFLPNFDGDEKKEEKANRQASLLFMRPLLIGDRLHAQYLRLDGPVPGADGSRIKASPKSSRHDRHSVCVPLTENVMDAFLSERKAQALFPGSSASKTTGASS